MMGKELRNGGIHETAFATVEKCDVDIRRDLYGNLILSGGSTMYPGIGERLQKELLELVPANVKAKVLASAEREDMVWIGGALVTTLSAVHQVWAAKSK